MSRFDEEPDGDPHGECAAEIHKLQSEIESLRAERDAAVAALEKMREECAKAFGVSVAYLESKLNPPAAAYPFPRKS